LRTNKQLLSLTVLIGIFASGLTGCATGYKRRPLNERQLLVDLQKIQLETLKPDPAPANVQRLVPNSSFDPANGITADEAVLIAEYLNPEIRAFRAERGIAEGELITARLLSNPELQFNLLNIQHFTTGLATAGVNSGLSWIPPRSGERAARIQRAQARVEEVRAEISEREWRLAAETRKAYYAVWVLQERRLLAEAALRLQARTLEFYEEKAKLGDTSRLEVNLARLAYGDSYRELQAIIADSDRVRQELNRILGLPPLYPVKVKTADQSLAYHTLNLDLASLEMVMLDHRPDLMAAKQAYEQAEQTVRIERLQRWPWFRLGPAVERDQGDNANAITKLGLGFSVDLPIFNRNQGEIVRAEAERNRARDAFVAALHGDRAELNEAYRNMKAQEQLLAIFDSKIKPALDDNARLTEDALQLRDFNLLQLITTQDRVLRMRRDYLNAQLEYWRSVFELEKATGAPVSDLMKQGVKP